MDSGIFGPESLIGRNVAGYHLDRLLGTGATGAVFLGSRLPETPAVVERTSMAPIELPAQAAIKVLIFPWGIAAEEKAHFQARFVREAAVLERLSHPHILSVLTSGEDAATGLLYMVLPYLSGGTLASRMANEPRPAPFDEIERDLIQLAAALDYAHGQGVIHRDIKPANVLLDEAGQVYLSDFSIAHLLADAHTKLTSTGRFLGTPAYMAPEQITGGDEIGPRADIYSLGMVVYELVTGRVAFEASSKPMEFVRQHLQDEPPPPQSVRADLPKPAEAAILTALRKAPDERFQSAGAFAAAFALGLTGKWAAGLTAYVSGAHTRALAEQHNATTVPVGPLPAIGQRQPARIRVLAVSASLLAIVLLLSGVVFSGLGHNLLAGAFALTQTSGSTVRHRSITTSNVLTPTATFALTATASPNPTATATRGPVATATPSPTATATPIPPPPHDVFTMFSLPTSGSADGIAAGPDGNLWFADGGLNTIGKITPSGAITEFNIPTPNAAPYQLAAGPDGNIWFSESKTNKVGRITLAGSITEFPVPTSTAQILGITAGSDGNIWFTEGDALKIGKISPSGTITEYPYSGAGSPSITLGPNGNLWFTEMWGNKIGEISTSGTVTDFAVPGGNPLGLTAGPDGNLWFVEYYGNKVGQITPYGAVKEFSIPTASSYPARISLGPDGNLWFTETASAGNIGRITLSGTITEYSGPTSGWGTATITLGPDGNLWCTAHNYIARFVL